MIQDLRIKVVVGSKNPVKVEAVAEAFQKYWPKCEVMGAEVSSGVSAQPMSELETMNGARQRAYGALKIDSETQYGVGIEGGVSELNPTSPSWSGMHGGRGKLYECAWVCVVKKSQITNSQILKSKSQEYEEGLGGGLYFELPGKIAQKIREGGELGPLMDEFTGKSNVKQGSGAIGIFTKGELDRKAAYVQIVLSALIKFVSPEWFG